MSVAEQRDDTAGLEAYPVTRDCAEWVAGLKTEAISETAFTWARHALLDWFGVTVAARDEPLVSMLAEECEAGADGPCTLVALEKRARLHDAALVNGAASHALDYDDVNRRLHGHPTVCVAPAALALGEVLKADGRAVLTAFIVGTEVACALGEMSDEGHYEAGFHATGTVGTFGAAAAAARLMGLDADATARALAIAASQAAGLKANFGTMTKPLHVGRAAANGLMAARLAARGFTAGEDAVEAPQGFAGAMAPGFADGPIRPDPAAPLAVEQTLFKYHAACYSTHATLEAIGQLRAEHAFGLDDVAAARVRVRPTHFRVCCIPAPRTGLEIKFGLAHLAAMALDGADTAALETYSDKNAADPRYVAAREETVRLEADDGIDRLAGAVAVELKDGRTLTADADVGAPAADLDRQWAKLSAKFDSLAAPLIGAERAHALREAVAGLDGLQDISSLMKAAR